LARVSAAISSIVSDRWARAVSGMRPSMTRA
jgi:hypothetical protein